MERGGMLDSTCNADIGEVFITPKAILRNEFCALSKDSNILSFPPAYTIAPYSIIGRTIALYNLSNVERSAPHCELVRHLNKFSLLLHLVFKCVMCLPMESCLSITTPRNLKCVT